MDENVDDRKLRKKYQVERAPELTKNRINLKGILQYSNASLVRCRGDIGYACCFCENQYPDPADLKRHTIETHDCNTMCAVMRSRRVYTMKMDITALQCKVCDEDMYDLEKLIDHLIDSHQQPLHKNVKSYILPVKFESDVLQCYICSKTVNNYKALIEHMNTHFRNFVCDICDAGFFSKDNLRIHSYVHDVGSHTCAHCPKQFKSIVKKKTHERLVHVTRNMVNKCGICNERFNSHYKKIVHLEEAHGVDPVVLNCKACDRTFTNRTALRHHVQSHHLLYRPHSCTECDMKFYKKIDLQEHMMKHTGVKNFKCDICSKSYGRRHTLREHMRIHLDDRRFKCEHCGKAFVQKCSWKGHMQTKHGEEVQ